MATYQAFTTSGAGYRYLCEGPDKAAVREAAERNICGDQWDQPKDIYVDTELKNLIVLPASQAQRHAEFRHAREDAEEAAQAASLLQPEDPGY